MITPPKRDQFQPFFFPPTIASPFTALSKIAATDWYYADTDEFICGLSQMNEFGMIDGLAFLMVTFVCLISVVGGGTRPMQHLDDRMSRGIRSSSGNFTFER
ncbi:hypothetical protein EDD85DRAFT_1029203 [Armillaria nabsnona]|nr:hypothetical protein EDD85DRAFT_1029203 [Armillaria nabsnona]